MELNSKISHSIDVIHQFYDVTDTKIIGCIRSIFRAPLFTTLVTFQICTDEERKKKEKREKRRQQRQLKKQQEIKASKSPKNHDAIKNTRIRAVMNLTMKNKDLSTENDSLRKRNQDLMNENETIKKARNTLETRYNNEIQQRNQLQGKYTELSRQFTDNVKLINELLDNNTEESKDIEESEDMEESKDTVSILIDPGLRMEYAHYKKKGTNVDFGEIAFVHEHIRDELEKLINSGNAGGSIYIRKSPTYRPSLDDLLCHMNNHNMWTHIPNMKMCHEHVENQKQHNKACEQLDCPIFFKETLWKWNRVRNLIIHFQFGEYHNANDIKKMVNWIYQKFEEIYE